MEWESCTNCMGKKYELHTSEPRAFDVARRLGIVAA